MSSMCNRCKELEQEIELIKEVLRDCLEYPPYPCKYDSADSLIEEYRERKRLKNKVGIDFTLTINDDNIKNNIIEWYPAPSETDEYKKIYKYKGKL